MSHAVEDWVPEGAAIEARPSPKPESLALAADDGELLHRYFERRADAQPDGIAVIAGEERVTYRSLERRANRLARHLRRRGVGRGSRIGLLLPRSADAYVGMLAILKAGAAYVPLDPEWPAQRIDFILGDAQCRALLTTDGLADEHAGFSGLKLRLDTDAPIFALESSARLTRRETGLVPADLSYIIYTSGSTGRPKGVMIEHRSVCHLVRVEGDLFGVAPYDRVLQAASLAFDLSVEEIWLALHSGATLVPASTEMLHAGPDLGRLIADAGVTVVSCVPTLVSMLPVEVPTIRLLILGGEVCPEPLVRRWAKEGRRVVNTYGPTETTVTATWVDVAPGKPVTIGQPIAGYTVRILDEQLRPVPPGAPGEICIGGPGVARGYLGREELTDEKFVPDPYESEPAARLYRTGDQGAMTKGGEIRFIGRLDGQVKLRGFRIELEEIESALTEVDGVMAAACSVREDAPGVQHLVGYVVMQKGIPPDVDAIRAHATTRLPAYMVPGMIEPIAKLPRSSTGKLDRAALPAPANAGATRTSNTRAPRNEVEARLAQVWGELFEPLPVGIDDHFFLDLGGHSMLAARMVSVLRKEPRFARASMVHLYEHPTISELAVVLAALEKDPAPVPRSAHAPPPAPAARQRTPWRIWSRHAIAGAVQAVGLYFPVGFRAVQWTAPYLAFFGLLLYERPLIEATAWAMVTSALLFPVLLLIAVAIKWIVLGRIKPGRYPLWGTYHLRWWFVRNIVASIPLEYLSGTPLLPLIYRLFGARIGRDVHIATEHFGAFDLISIGDESCIDDECTIAGGEVEDGELIIGPVTIGRRCFVGTRSVLREGVVMEDGARLEDLTFLGRGAHVPKGETWAGSPARWAPGRVVARPRPHFGPVRRAATALLYAVLIALLPASLLVAAIPGLTIMMEMDVLADPFRFVLITPLIGALFAAGIAMQVVAVKWILVGRVKAGSYPIHGWFYVRNWVVDQYLKLGIDMLGSVHATLYAANWYRLLGAKLGRMVEFSTAAAVTPDLIEISDGGTIADEVSLGSARIEGGWITLATTRVGEKAFAGNSAVVPSGATIGDGSLIGVLSLAPTTGADAGAPGTAWLGSPPMRLPRRQPSASFPDSRTYYPPRRMRVIRRIVELARITIPSAGFVVMSATVITATFALWESIGLFPALALIPFIYGAASVALLLLVAAAKWVIDGRFRRFVHPLWSVAVWRLEFVNALYEFLAAPLILDSLRGTPFLPWYLRLLGARIGRRVYIDTTGFLEFDLVEIGDEAAINDDVVIQTHLFEDRVLKASKVRIGARCSVGTTSVVLYDSSLEPGSRLDALSLVMKGETLPAGTAWAGVPATWHDWRPGLPSVAAA